MKISICLILVLSCKILAQEINEISVGDYLELSYDPNSGKNALYYKVTLKDLDIQNETEIGVFVRPLDYKSDPDVFISTTNEYPSTEDREIECSLYGFDVCYFPEKYRKVNQTFYLAVNCENTCQFSLQVDLKQTIQIDFNTTKLVKLASKSEHIYHLSIPNLPDLQHFRVLFTFYGISSTQPTIWIVQGNAPANTNWNQVSLPVFYAPFGNIFIASKEQFPRGFCVDCNYTISIEVEDEAMLKITSLPGEQIENISLWQEINDGVVIGGQQVYVLDTVENVYESEKIEWSDNDRINDTLVFEMAVYEGNPDLYISCDSMPEELSAFTWSSNFWRSEALVIGPDDFAKLTPGSCKKMYIVVYGKRWSVYKLLVKRVTKSNINMIKAGEYEVGILEQGHIQNFIMTINKEEIQKNTVVVTDLTALRGNPDLYIKGCESLQNCTITEKDIEQADQLANNESMFFLYSTNVESEHYEFLLKNDNCLSPDIHPMCFYVFGVYGSKTNDVTDTETKFSLIVSLSNGLVQLKENVPQKYSLPLYTWKYFRFQITDSTDIEEIDFQLTFVYGEADIAISRKNPKPDFRNADKVGCFCVNMVNYTKKLDGDLTGNYYVGVYSIAECTFIINTFIERNSTKDLYENVISLENGMPQKVVHNTSVLYNFFKFKVTNLNKPIEIKLTIQKGKNFSMFVNNYKELTKGINYPSEKYRDFISEANKLIIEPNEYSGKYFLITVKYYGEDKKDDNYQFIIEFQTYAKLLKLYPNVLYSNTLLPDHPLIFEFTITKEDIFIYLSLSSEFQGATLELSKDYDFKCSSSIDHALGHHSTSKLIMLSGKEIEYYCDFSINYNCKLYTSISTLNTFQTDILLLFEKFQNLTSLEKMKFPSIGLIEGMILELQLQESQERHFYLHAKDPNRAYLIYFFTTEGIIDVDYEIVNQREKTSGQGLLDGLFPEIDEKAYKIDPTRKYTCLKKLLVTKSDFEKVNCDVDCMILITMRVQKLFSLEQSMPKMFTIQVQTETQKIFVGQQVLATISKGESNFYEFENKICSSVMTVTLDMMDKKTDVDLYITKGSYYTKESKEDNIEWSSTLPGSLQDQVTIKNCECGFYTIEVVGISEGENSYQLQISSYKDKKLLKLYNGQYLDYSLQSKEQIYFYYDKASSEVRSISFNLEKYYGSGTLQIIQGNISEQVDDSLNFDDICKKNKLQCINVYIPSRLPSYHVELAEFPYIWSEKQCRFLIKFKADEDSRIQVQMTDIQNNGWINDGMAQFIYFNGKEESSEKAYEYKISDHDKDIEVQFHIMSGEQFLQELLIIGEPIGNDEAQENYVIYNEKPKDGLLFTIPKKKYKDKESLLIIIKTNLKNDDEKKNIVANLLVCKKEQKKETKGIGLVQGSFVTGNLDKVGEKVEFFFTDKFRETAQTYYLTIFTKGFNISTLSDLLSYVKINVTCSCVKCEESVVPQSFSLIFMGSNYQSDKGQIRGSEDMFYLQFQGAARGIYHYNIKFTYLKQIKHSSFNFQIIHNFEGIVLLPQKYIYTGELHVRSEDVKQIFMIYIEQKGTLAIQFDKCQGIYELKGGNSLEEIEKGWTDSKLEVHYYSDTSGKQMVKTSVDPGTYYLEVTAIAGPGKYDPPHLILSGKFFIFRIQAQLLSETTNQIPQFFILAGNEGNLTHEFIDDRKTLQVSVDKLQFSQFKQQPQQFQHYKFVSFLYVTLTRSENQLIQTCKFTTKSYLKYEWFNHAIYTSEINEADKTDKVTFKIPIDQLVSDLMIEPNSLKYIFASATILAVFNDEDINKVIDNIWDLEINGNAVEIDYNQKYIKMNEKSSFNYWKILIVIEFILIFGSIALIIFGLILFRRYKIMRNNIKFQMHEEPETQMANI